MLRKARTAVGAVIVFAVLLWGADTVAAAPIESPSCVLPTLEEIEAEEESDDDIASGDYRLYIEEDCTLDQEWLWSRQIELPKDGNQSDTLSIVDGALICCGSRLVAALGAHVIDMSGGQIQGELWGYSKSQIHLSGGIVGGSLWTYTTATVEMTGGEVSLGAYARYKSNIHISGGQLLGELAAYEDATAQLSGGSAHSVAAHHRAGVVISGGTVAGGQLQAFGEAATIELQGSGFELNGEAIAPGDLQEATTGKLTGILAQGSWFEGFFYHNGHDDSRTGLVSVTQSEPQITTLSDGSPLTISDDSYAETAVSVQGGSQVDFAEGAQVINIYADNGAVAVSGGSVAASVLSAGSSSVELSAGEVVGGLYALDSSTMGYSGGSVAGGLHAHHNSQITISGFDFEVDRVPVPDGVLPQKSGVLTGVLSSGEPIANEFFQSGFDPVETGSIIVDIDEALSNVVALEPGTSHTLNDATYQASTVTSLGNANLAISSGAVVDRMNVEGETTASMDGGSIESSLVVADSAELTLGGGRLKGDLAAYNGASVDLSGGRVEGTLYAYGDSEVVITGREFEINRVPQPLGGLAVAQGTLEVVLASLEEVEIDFAQPDLVHGAGRPIVLSPSAATSTLFTNGGSHVINDDALGERDVLVGGSATQLALSEGGVVFDLYAGDTATLSLNGGEVDDDVIVGGSAIADMTGGVVNEDVAVHDSALLRLRGGMIGGKLFLDGGGSVEILGSAFELSPTGSGSFPIPYGEPITEREGIITGVLESGEPLWVRFNRGETGSGLTGTLTVLPEPTGAALQLAALGVIFALARRRGQRPGHA